MQEKFRMLLPLDQASSNVQVMANELQKEVRRPLLFTPSRVSI